MTWKTEYVFQLKPRQLQEFAAMCSYHQNSADSPFTQKRLCSRATPDGRITLSEMKLMTTHKGARAERVLTSDEEWFAVLEKQFGVSPGAGVRRSS